MELNIAELIGKSGFSLPDIITGVSKFTAIVPVIKENIPKIAEFEKSFGAKPGQKIMYTLMPVIPALDGTETEEQVKQKNSKSEIRFMVLLVEQQDGKTVVVDEKVCVYLFEEVEKITQLIPAMPDMK